MSRRLPTTTCAVGAHTGRCHTSINDRGHSYAQIGDLDNAHADFEKAITLQAKDHALAHANRGWVLAQRDKHD